MKGRRGERINRSTHKCKETHHFGGIRRDGIQFHFARWSVALSSVTSAVYQQFLSRRHDSQRATPPLCWTR